MKNLTKIIPDFIMLALSLILASILLTSCATNSTPEGQAQNAATYGQTAQVSSYGITCWVLSLSKGDAQDLADKKAILKDVVKYLTIARDQGMTGANVASGLLSQVPEKWHWNEFVSTFKSVLTYATGLEARAILSGLIVGIEQAVAAF